MFGLNLDLWTVIILQSTLFTPFRLKQCTTNLNQHLHIRDLSEETIAFRRRRISKRNIIQDTKVKKTIWHPYLNKDVYKNIGHIDIDTKNFSSDEIVKEYLIDLLNDLKITSLRIISKKNYDLFDFGEIKTLKRFEQVHRRKTCTQHLNFQISNYQNHLNRQFKENSSIEYIKINVLSYMNFEKYPNLKYLCLKSLEGVWTHLIDISMCKNLEIVYSQYALRLSKTRMPKFTVTLDRYGDTWRTLEPLSSHRFFTNDDVIKYDIYIRDIERGCRICVQNELYNNETLMLKYLKKLHKLIDEDYD